MNKAFTIFVLSLLIIAGSLSSCGKKDEPTPINNTAKRTVLVYMVATNSLGSSKFDIADIAEMEVAMKQFPTSDFRLLVYHATYENAPKLIEITSSGSSTLKKYPSTLRASVTKKRLSDVINDTKSLAPANDYGLILWSHASGWSVSLSSIRGNAQPKYFGIDQGAMMQLDSLADAIPNNLFSFIYTDACHMGAIESVYQLRNKTKYYISSPAETPAYGLPYDIAIPYIFEESANLLKLCESTYNYYNSKTGTYRSLTISMVDCSKLEPLANVCKEIHAQAKPLTDISNIQYYNQHYPHFFFDLKQYTDLITPSTELSESFNKALTDAIIYKAHTPTIFGSLIIKDENYSGLSTYIMGTGSAENEAYYKTLDWYNDVIKQ